MDRFELIAGAVQDWRNERRARKARQKAVTDPRQFVTDDGAVYQRVPAAAFPSFDDVDSIGVPAPRRRGGSRALSQNGWTANDRSLIGSYTVPGTSRKLAIRKGDVSVVLLDIAAWIHANIEPIDTGTLDDWGYAERTVRGSDTVVSNHASGTAIDLGALKHPRGKRGTWGANASRIRERLKAYDGVIRWGEDYRSPSIVDGMHLEINAGSAAVAKVADRIRGGQTTSEDTPSTTYCKYGERSDNVLKLQRFMIATFPSYNSYLATGFYGAATKSGMAEFQRRTGVTGPDADGSIVGRRTLAALAKYGFKP